VIGAAVAAGRYICELDRTKAAARDASIRAQAAQKQGETAADLIPAITTGFVAAGTASAGERFIQPLLADGRKLDDLTGGGWRLFVRSAGNAAPVPGVAQIMADELPDDGAVQAWLDARSADAVLVRPDHYVFGTGTPAELLEARAFLLGLNLETAA
jgi:3-(3-hydroxy-phenyl)propionate hydroxylase